VSAGIAAFQSHTSNYYFGVKLNDNKYNLFLEQTNKSTPAIIATLPVDKKQLGKNIVLGLEGDAGKITFFYHDKKGKRINVAKDVDAKILSTEVAGGFVGTYLGMHTRLE
jgi:alpha-N-arabinofuranosidase